MAEMAKTKRIPKQKIPATLKNAVWATYNGPMCVETECYCCGLEKISRSNFAAGHINAEATGGTVTLDNLRPICTLCNSSMARTNMRQFILQYRLRGKFADELDTTPTVADDLNIMPDYTTNKEDAAPNYISETELLSESKQAEAEGECSESTRAKECPFCIVRITNMSTHQKTIRHMEAVMAAINTGLSTAQHIYDTCCSQAALLAFSRFFTQYAKTAGDTQIYQTIVSLAHKLTYSAKQGSKKLCSVARKK